MKYYLLKVLKTSKGLRTMNITEKILAKGANKKTVNPGEIIEAEVDLAMTHDGTSPPTIKTFKKISDKVWDPDKIVIICDHTVPPNTIGSAEFHKVTREFAREQGIKNILIMEKGYAIKFFQNMDLSNQVP